MKTRKIKLMISVFAFSAAFALTAFGQTQTERTENFELNIVRERIRETNFERSTAAELKDETRGNLSVKIGVGASAGRIDALLQGIFGNVRFRASLAPIRAALERRKSGQTPAPGAP